MTESQKENPVQEPSNTNTRLLARIEAALPGALAARAPGNEDFNVLTYIKAQLQPEQLAWRDNLPSPPGTVHLHEVANRRLKPYEKKEAQPV